jgi:glycosyltransferase involved in cell wall biosynthesis
MKICYLANTASIHTARWANYFSRKGHQVDILSFEPANRIDANIRVHRVGRPWPFKMHYFSRGRAVRDLLRQIQPDILHAHYASGYATLGRLAGFHPYVVSVWGSDIFDFAQKSRIHRRIVVANLKSADRVCSTSQVMADEIRLCCQRDIDVTPFGVDCERFRPGSPSNRENEFVVGIVKALEPKYGIEYLIRGFAIFSKRNTHMKKLRLMIAGDGSLRDSLRCLARDLHIDTQTIFLGFVPHERVPEILSRVSVFVAPSVSESFGVAVLEASASGLPVVVSKIGGLPEVVRDRITGILIPPRDPAAIADALEELLKDDQLRSRLGANGRNYILENYEWTENAGRMDQIYESLLRGRN